MKNIANRRDSSARAGRRGAAADDDRFEWWKAPIPELRHGLLQIENIVTGKRTIIRLSDDSPEPPQITRGPPPWWRD